MSGTVSSQTPFTAACGVIARILGGQEDGELARAEEEELAAAVGTVRSVLPRLLSRRVQAEDQDPQEVAHEALVRFFAAARAQRLKPGGSPSGYLMIISVNIVRDARRGGPEPLPLPDAALLREGDGDPFARLVDGLAARDTVRRALTRARDKGDAMVLEVVAAWLDLAARTNAAPASRAVAEEVGISKSTVANALLRFRGYLAESG
ncbi:MULTISPECIES: RNA polymerase sigma factor [Streptomyces]|uniref:RNA polymerase sigma factor n=1 Tax=Streptomyces TaxID=1883 RepID=UPI002249100D|nr:hypothetical protein [Streptomyces sp. JHD 1]MCX2968761.1 hypothetical protein [Streptomyces sp. JHD 1]